MSASGLTPAWRSPGLDRLAELKAEGSTRCTIELEPTGDAVKMTITHESERPGSKLIGAVSGGWPMIASNLKSLLETGRVAVSLK